MLPSYVSHVCHIHYMCAMTHTRMRDMCAMTHSHMSAIIRQSQMSHTYHMYEYRYVFTCDSYNAVRHTYVYRRPTEIPSRVFGRENERAHGPFVYMTSLSFALSRSLPSSVPLSLSHVLFLSLSLSRSFSLSLSPSLSLFLPLPPLFLSLSLSLTNHINVTT